MDAVTQYHPPAVVLDDVALFFDVDGTLIDIAPRPDEVFVSPGLLKSLARLQEQTDGAVAIVSGRALSDIDRLFHPLKLAAIGGHGAEMRPTPDGPVDTANAYPLHGDLTAQLISFCEGREGVIIENKGYSLAIHYRLAPEQESAIRDGVAAICAKWPGTISVLPGKAVVEVKHTGVSKGTALKKLMKLPPFAGRAPIFIGDDTTDEAAIAAMPEFDGFGLSVGRTLPGAVFEFSSPREVRRWLEKISSDE